MIPQSSSLSCRILIEELLVKVVANDEVVVRVFLIRPRMPLRQTDTVRSRPAYCRQHQTPCHLRIA
jgi:hypothetical protein